MSGSVPLRNPVILELLGLSFNPDPAAHSTPAGEAHTGEESGESSGDQKLEQLKGLLHLPPWNFGRFKDLRCLSSAPATSYITLFPTSTDDWGSRSGIIAD
jgi:hypothetical protein